MKRRELVAFIGGAAVLWAGIARAQQPDRTRVIGMFQGVTASDPGGKIRYAAFQQELQRLGWTEGRNVRIERRWAEGNADIMRRQATELVALSPDVIVTTGGDVTERVLQATRTVPVVFTVVPDPVGSGLVKRLSRPGGNATGFMQFEYTLTAKWLELLKQIAPSVSRAAIFRDPAIAPGVGQFAVIQSVAPSLGMEVIPISISEAVDDIERAVSDFARDANGGLIVTASATAVARRQLIVSLAARYKLPAVYFNRDFVADGGLISYGADFTEMYRQAASYVDRILKGEKAADLPVQAPNRYELVINLKTAKTQGLTLSPTLLARADEVLE